MTYLIDTDVTIDGLNNRRASIELLSQLANDGLAISVLSLGELYDGAYIHPDLATYFFKIHEFIEAYRILGVSEDTMRIFARERARLRRQGLPIPDFGLVIAATAISRQLTLVSRNRRHFERIEGLNLLTIDVS
jgi:tRNA(fMet)-specific endonuclease VapC